MRSVDPGADVAPANRTYRVVLQDGTTVTGRLLGHDTFTVQLLDTQRAAALVHEERAARARLRAVADAVVPRDAAPQEIADMVSYLSSLRGQ